MGPMVLDMVPTAASTLRESVWINNCFLSVMASFDSLLEERTKQSPFEMTALVTLLLRMYQACKTCRGTEGENEINLGPMEANVVYRFLPSW